MEGCSLGTPKSLDAYSFEEGLFAQTAASENGTLGIFPQHMGVEDSLRWATRMCQRLNSCRALQRRLNAKIYPDEGHQLHGRSIYDNILITKKQSATATSLGTYYVEMRTGKALMEGVVVKEL